MARLPDCQVMHIQTNVKHVILLESRLFKAMLLASTAVGSNSSNAILGAADKTQVIQAQLALS